MLVRDRVGIKPLYYAIRNADLYFGSEMKAILLHPEIPRYINPSALDRYLALNYIPGTETMVEGIEKLSPGCWIEWQEGRAKIERYWKLEFRPESRWDLAFGKRGARSPAARFRAGTSDCGCSSRRVVERRTGFLRDFALRRGRVFVAPENVFGFLSGPQLR